MDVLVLGPGGIKGYQELGVLLYLEETKKLGSFHTLIGVSVGSIILLLHNIGLTVKDILYVAISNASFVDLDNINIFNIFSNFKKHSGIFSNRKIYEVLTGIIIERLGYIPTLRELYETTNKELIIVTYNLTKEAIHYLSYKTNPDMSCIDAIMLSINIPILFYMMEVNGDIYIDGAFGDPYPVLLKDNGKNKILGIYIQSECDAKDSMLLYIHNIIHCFFSNLIKRNIKESSNNCKHIVLKCEIIDTIGVNLTLSDKVRMFLYGYSVAKSFNYDY